MYSVVSSSTSFSKVLLPRILSKSIIFQMRVTASTLRAVLLLDIGCMWNPLEQSVRRWDLVAVFRCNLTLIKYITL
nr:AlNc14C271G9966 [Albugo laibachii Nc14]|eukprot:CCA25026.1 AlNc14C271G9966 [Albugo laibachii Nc14]